MIPADIKERIRDTVNSYNMKCMNGYFIVRFREEELFLDLCRNGRIILFCRLRFSSSDEMWECSYYDFNIGEFGNTEITELGHHIFEKALEKVI